MNTMKEVVIQTITIVLLLKLATILIIPYGIRKTFNKIGRRCFKILFKRVSKAYSKLAYKVLDYSTRWVYKLKSKKVGEKEEELISCKIIDIKDLYGNKEKEIM